MVYYSLEEGFTVSKLLTCLVLKEPLVHANRILAEVCMMIDLDLAAS